MIWWQILIIVVVSYFMGNISFSRFLAKTKNKDITKLGSGNPGMTNTLRNFGVKLGVVNLILDMLKAFIPLSNHAPANTLRLSIIEPLPSL